MHSTGQAGHLVYGPYMFLAAGHYEVRIKGSFAGQPGPNPNIEVAVKGGNDLLARGDLYSDRWSEDGDRVLGFNVATDCTDLEIRVWVEACNLVTLSIVEIHQIATYNIAS